jgi:hypothetical protein
VLCHAHFPALPASSRSAWREEGGQAHLLRYKVKAESKDLDRALELLQRSVDETSLDSSDRPRRMYFLGSALTERYERKGEMADLQAAADVTPPGSTNRPAILVNLGMELRERYQHRGNPDDLARALQIDEEAFNAPLSESARITLLHNWAIALQDRYRFRGDPTDLERAIEFYTRVIAATPPGSPDQPMYLSALGVALRNYYDRTQELSVLEQAIQRHEEAVNLTPDDSPARGMRLNNLGVALLAHYWRLKERGDLEQAMVDLEQAMEACEKAVSTTPEDFPDFPIVVYSLAQVLQERYARKRDSADLDKTIQRLEVAKARTLPGSPNWSAILNELGLAFRERYEHTENLADLEQAIAAHEQTITTASPQLPDYLNNLRIALLTYYEHTANLAHLERAIASEERAWALLQTALVSSPVADKLGQQRKWTSFYGGFVSDYLQLVTADPLTAPASRRRALEIAEGSKSRLLTELAGRGDLPAPPALAEQATHEKALLAELTKLDAAALASYGRLTASETEGSDTARWQLRQKFWQELEDLWQVMAQADPEATDYVALRRGDSPTWNDLDRLVMGLGPQTALLSLFTTTDRTLLFILRGGWEAPEVVGVDLNRAEWEGILRCFDREIHTSAGSDRGEAWVRPFQRLLCNAAGYLEGLERVVLAPEGLGHLLPWSVVAQRAGWHSSDGQPLPLVTLPALGLLPRLLRRPSYPDGPALVVGNPRGDLKYAEQEAQEVGALFGVKPLGSDATKGAVLEQLAHARIVHLATHARFDLDSPLDSGITLVDGNLTAREVLGLRLQADLVVLSACETGMARMLAGRGDELAGLAQAFLQAGVRSLLVSLWKANDPATAALMKAFYDARRAGADKALALSQAMAGIRAQGKWSHPYYWGAFVLMGDW